MAGMMRRTGPVDLLVRIRLAQGKYADAEQLLGQMLKSNPQGQPLRIAALRMRGSYYARCRRWAEAIADMKSAVELDPADEDSDFALAVLLLENGDKKGYRAVCQKMMERFGAAKAANPLGRTAEACLLLRDAGPNSEASRLMADQAYTLGRNSFLRQNLQFVKALAEHRGGQFQSPIDSAGKCFGQPTMAGGTRPEGAAYGVSAMAQHQLKRPEKARAALAKAAEVVNGNLLKHDNASLDEYWVDWLVAHILLQEAQALVEPSE